MIEVLESRTNEQGQQRVRFMYQPDVVDEPGHFETEGWTFVVSAKGNVILEPEGTTEDACWTWFDDEKHKDLLFGGFLCLSACITCIGMH